MINFGEEGNELVKKENKERLVWLVLWTERKPV